MGRSDDSEFSGRVEAAAADSLNAALRSANRERERAEAAEQRLKACESAHGETQRQLQEARAGDIGPYSDQLVSQLGELIDAVDRLRRATLAHDRAVLLLLDCRALLERVPGPYTTPALGDEIAAMLVRLRKVKSWPAVVKE